MNYIEILKRAAGIAWHNKTLWFFGFLVVLLEGANARANSGSGSSGWRWPGEGTGGRGMGQLPSMNWPPAGITPGIVAAIILLVLVLAILAVMLNMVSNGALIGLVRDIEGGQRIGIRRGFSIGFRRFLSYFGINFVISAPAGLLTIGLVLLGCSPLLLLLARSGPATTAAVVLTVILMIPIGLFLVVLWSLLSLLLELFLRACVVERLGVSASLSRGWDVFAANVGRSLSMAILLFGCGILFALLMVPLAVGLLGGAVMATMLAWAFTHSLGWTVAVALILGVPAVLILAFVGGIYKAFTSAAWTLAYLRMAGLERGPGAAGSPAQPPAAPAAEGPAPESAPAVSMGSSVSAAGSSTDVVVDGASE